MLYKNISGNEKRGINCKDVTIFLLNIKPPCSTCAKQSLKQARVYWLFTKSNPKLHPCFLHVSYSNLYQIISFVSWGQFCLPWFWLCAHSCHYIPTSVPMFLSRHLLHKAKTVPYPIRIWDNGSVMFCYLTSVCCSPDTAVWLHICLQESKGTTPLTFASCPLALKCHCFNFCRGSRHKRASRPCIV